MRQHEAEVSRLQRDSPPRPNPNLPAPTRLGTDRRVHGRQVFRGEIQAQTTVSVCETETQIQIDTKTESSARSLSISQRNTSSNYSELVRVTDKDTKRNRPVPSCPAG